MSILLPVFRYNEYFTPCFMIKLVFYSLSESMSTLFPVTESTISILLPVCAGQRVFYSQSGWANEYFTLDLSGSMSNLLSVWVNEYFILCLGQRVFYSLAGSMSMLLSVWVNEYFNTCYQIKLGISLPDFRSNEYFTLCLESMSNLLHVFRFNGYFNLCLSQCVFYSLLSDLMSILLSVLS